MSPTKASKFPMSRLLAAALLIPLLAACGGNAAPSSGGPSGSAKASVKPSTSAAGSGDPSAAPSDASPSASADASPGAPVQQLACDATGPGWPVTALSKPGDAETGTTAAAQALNAFITGSDGADLPDTGWQELYRSKELALYGMPDATADAGTYVVARVRATNGAWAFEDSSQCHPRTWLGSTLGIAGDWKLAAKTTKTARTIKALVTERACASGESAKGRLAKPRISYEADQIVITIGVTPLDGSQDCQANPATPLTITLTEAIGDRQLFDGGPYPAFKITQPK